MPHASKSMHNYLLEDLTSKTSTSRSYAGKLYLLLPDAKLALLLLPFEEAKPSPLSLRLPGCSMTSTISSSCLSSRTSWSSERCLMRALTSPQTVSDSAYLEHMTQQYWPSGPSRWHLTTKRFWTWKVRSVSPAHLDISHAFPGER